MRIQNCCSILAQRACCLGRNAQEEWVRVETKYPAPGLGRLCFNATERLHHPGRYINHVAQKPNIKLTRPFEVHGKPRIGFLAFRDIPAGEELCYDYGDRSGGEWMRKGRLLEGRVVAGVEQSSQEEGEIYSRKKSNKTCQQVMKRRIVAEEDTSSDEEEIATKPKRKTPKRRLVYCPIPECASAPLKKVLQHLRQYHQLVMQRKTKSNKRKERMLKVASVTFVRCLAARGGGLERGW